MLASLTIRNFAIVDRLDVAWEHGFNVITGETGAGKSIIVDAVGALLGDRVGPEVVRTGADRATVEGLFVIGDDVPPELAAVLEEYGLEPEDGGLIVTRDIAAAGGRGGARVNGRSVPLSVLQQVGEHLVDIHGQSQHMLLLRAREQLELLDRYGAVLARRAAVAELVRQVRAVREEIRQLRANERQAAREQDILRHEIDEIERADLRDGEEDELQAARSRLQHVERLLQAATTAHDALQGTDDGARLAVGAVDSLGQAITALAEGARYDGALAQQAESLNAALSLVDDAIRALRTYLDDLEADPEALDRTEERLFVLAALRRKYGDTVADVLAHLAESRARLERYEHREERLADLERDESRLLALAASAAADLSARRREAGDRLGAAVEGELADLQMRGTRFSVGLHSDDAADGLHVGDRRLAFDQTGVDRVDFLIAPNAGEVPRPMARIASGGELARIALAVKTVLSRTDTRATLIFDEVDAGVGGRTAPVVGQKLWNLAAAGHQVLCVTHLPQVASFADRHWVVAKTAVQGSERTSVSIGPLDPAAQVEEIAAMLSGSPTASTRDSARELLHRATTAKSVARAGDTGANGSAPASRLPPASPPDPVLSASAAPPAEAQATRRGPAAKSR